jgi:uncharacterized iron-regulated membrane protein
MPWWALILLAIGVCGGLPVLAFLALFGVEMWRERRFNASAEARAERLAESYAVTEPRPAAGLSGLREALDAAARSPRSGPPDPPPHQGWRT